MVQFMNMPAVQYPRSALLDFSPVSNALAGYTQGINADEKRKQMQAIGQSAATGGYGDASKAAYQAGELDAGLQFQKLGQDDAERKKKRLGAMAQAVDMEQDPARRDQMWQGLLKRVGDVTGLTPEELHPMTGPKLLMAEAGLVNDPLERDLKLAQIAKMKTDAAEGGADYGRTGSILQDKDGNFYSVQFGSNGQKKVEPLRLGETGLSPSRGTATIDTGTGTQVIDKATGLPVRNVDKNLLEAERQKEIGGMTGKQDASAPADVAAADQALQLIDKIVASPGREVGTGLSSFGNYIPGTKGYDFQNLVDQSKSGAFLTAIQQMRGLGSLSNAEGDTATRAVARMNTATSEEAFIDGLNDYRNIVMKGRERAAARISKGTAPQPQAAPAAPQNNGWSIERLD